jgi:hypothetical protein
VQPKLLGETVWTTAEREERMHLFLWTLSALEMLIEMKKSPSPPFFLCLFIECQVTSKSESKQDLL